MAYQIINPPFTLAFHEMSKKDLICYGKWLLDVSDERIALLGKTIAETGGYESWTPNGHPESLNLLGAWLEKHVTVRNRSQEEFDVIRERLSYLIDITAIELTNETLSLAIDIGLYFARVIHANVSTAKWEQHLSNKKFVDYGQMVISGFGSMYLNPIRIVVNLAYGISNGRQSGDRLRELYEIWSSMSH